MNREWVVVVAAVLSGAGFAAPTAEAVRIVGQTNLVVRGEIYSNRAVRVEASANVTFEDCTFWCEEGAALSFRTMAGTNAVRRCRINGASGVDFVESPDGAIVVEDCTIRQCGAQGGLGVKITWGGSATVAHNDVSGDFAVGLVVAGIGDYAVENNLVHDSNFVHPLATGIGAHGAKERTRLVGNTVFNFLQGISISDDVGVLVASNLVYNTRNAAYWQRRCEGVRLENNILSKTKGSPLDVGGGGSLRAVHNIFYWGEGDFLAASEKGGTNLTFSNNQFCCREGDGTARFGGRTLAEWQAAGGDRGAIECDALLTDPDGGNYRVRPDARAMEIGFKRFDPFAAGVRADYSNYRYPLQTLSPHEAAYRRGYETEPPVTDDGMAAKRPEIRNGTWFVGGKPEYYLGVWVYNCVREWRPGTNPLAVDHFAYTERPGTNSFPRLGFNSAQLSCAHDDVGRILHGAKPRRDVDAFEAEMLDFYRGFGDMPFVVDFAFGYTDIYPKPVRVALDQRKFDWHNFIPLCPENPEGDAYYRDFFLGGVRSALRAKANVFLWELFNESAYNCECAYNRRDFAARMVAKYGSLAAVNAKWGTAYADAAEIAAADSFMANPAAWYDWCVFSAQRYNEILAKYRAVIETADRRERVHFTEQAAGCPPVHRGMDLRGADALDVLAIEGGWRYGDGVGFAAKSDMEAVVAVRGSQHFYNCDFHQALAKGRKVIVNDEHYCARLENGRRVPSKRTDYITSLWLEVMHGVSANYTYVWDKRAWEYKDAEGARRNVEKPSYKSSSLLNPYNVKPEDLAAFREFQEELAPYKEKILPFPRVKPATVAVFFSKPTQIQRDRLPKVDPSLPLWRSQPDRAGVWYVALLHALYPVKVVFEEDLDGLDVEAVVLPDSQYVLPEVVEKLRAFEKRGGLVVAAEDSLAFDAWGKPLAVGKPFPRVGSIADALALLGKRGVRKYAAIDPLDGLSDPIFAADVQICDRGDFKLVCLADLGGRRTRRIALRLLFDEPADAAYRVYDPVNKRELGAFTVAELAKGIPLDLPTQERVLVELTALHAE